MQPETSNISFRDLTILSIALEREAMALRAEMSLASARHEGSIKYEMVRAKINLDNIKTFADTLITELYQE